jgi:MFS family permease
MLSDTKGRRFTVLVSLIGAFLSSLLTVFTPIIEIYILGRFFDGVFFGGYSVNTFILSIEYSRPGYFALFRFYCNAVYLRHAQMLLIGYSC